MFLCRQTRKINPAKLTAFTVLYICRPIFKDFVMDFRHYAVALMGDKIYKIYKPSPSNIPHSPCHAHLCAGVPNHTPKQLPPTLKDPTHHVMLISMKESSPSPQSTPTDTQRPHSAGYANF